MYQVGDVFPNHCVPVLSKIRPDIRDWWDELSTREENATCKYESLRSFAHSKAETREQRRWIMHMFGARPDPNLPPRLTKTSIQAHFPLVSGYPFWPASEWQSVNLRLCAGLAWLRSLSFLMCQLERRVGANGQGRIHQGTRQRMLQIARDLGYKPNLAARALSIGKGFRIGVCIPKELRLFYDQVRHGIFSEARRHEHLGLEILYRPVNRLGTLKIEKVKELLCNDIKAQILTPETE